MSDEHVCTIDCGCGNGQCNCGKGEECEIVSAENSETMGEEELEEEFDGDNEDEGDE